jgi:hypothetical protein
MQSPYSHLVRQKVNYALVIYEKEQGKEECLAEGPAAPGKSQEHQLPLRSSLEPSGSSLH